MNPHHSNLLHEDMMFNRSHGFRSLSPNPKFNTEDESKADHIANLQKEYNKRLIQPLQVNSRFKLQAEAAIGSASGQFRGPKNPIVHEDTERKKLINQVKEIDRISVYGDKEAGIKRRKKVTKQKSILEQHLQEDLYNYIKAVKERAIELKKAQIAERKLILTEGEASREVSFHKDPKKLFHKQLDVIKAEKDKNLKPKQLNSNSYFRYSERKMLLLRSAEEMEIVPQQDKTGKAFFREEAKKEKLRRRPVALLTKKSISFKSNEDKSSFSMVPLQNKPSQDLRNSQCSPTAIATEPKNVAFYKAYDLMGANRESRNLDTESSEYPTIHSPGISTPTDAHNKQPRFFGHNLPVNHENESHSRRVSHSLVGRTSSQAFVIDAKSAEIIEDREGESQTQRNLEEGDSYQSQTVENYQSGEEEQNRSENVSLIKKPTTNFYPGFGSEKVVRSKYWMITDNETKPTEEDVATKKLRESFRKNLLGNIQRAKSQKGMLTEGENQAMSLTIKKWPEINQPAILEQEPIKPNRPGRTFKKIKRKNAKNTTSDHVMTETDYESYIKELQGDKPPIREEMQDLLSKYGYEDAAVDARGFASNRLVKQKSHYSGMLQNSMNREKLKKIDRFLRQTSFKSTKAIKVD